MPPTGKHEMLDVQKIELDLNNPRIKKWIAIYGENPNSEQISLALGAGGDGSEGGQGSQGTTFSSLRESIRTNGGIIHPIIVNESDDGVMTVIEGNTRVAIYREFVENSVRGEWSKIPAIVYRQLSQEQIDAIRLQAHLVGPRAWDPYSKAKYLHYLHDSESMPIERLVEYCGGRRREVTDYIAAYEEMERYYRPLCDSDAEFDTRKFSGFVEVQRQHVREAILSSGYTLTDFSKWIFAGLIDPLNNVRLLPRIMKDEKARQIFLNEGSREAVKYLDRNASDANLDDVDMLVLSNVLRKKISEMGWRDVQLLQSGEKPETYDILETLQTELSSLLKYVDSGVSE